MLQDYASQLEQEEEREREQEQEDSPERQISREAAQQRDETHQQRAEAGAKPDR